MFFVANLLSPSKKSLPSTMTFVTTFPSTSTWPSSLISTPGKFSKTSSSLRSVPLLKESALYVKVSPLTVTGISYVNSTSSNKLSSSRTKSFVKSDVNVSNLSAADFIPM